MKYLGGKYRQAKRIVATIRERHPDASVWIEPFLGGANVAVQAAPHFDQLILNELDPAIAEMWRAGVAGWEPPETVSKDEYCDLKSAGAVDALTGFVSIAASYNGKRWGGWSGGYTERNFYDEIRRAYLRDSLSLRQTNVVVLSGSYMDLATRSDLPQLGGQAVCYCDPPYAGTTGYGTAWNPDEFWPWAAQRLVPTYVSEYNAPDGWTLIDGYQRKVSMDPTRTPTKVELDGLFTRLAA